MSTRRLRILSIASACPFPPHGGTRILIYHQVRELARHHDVDLVMVDCPTAVECDPGGLDFCRSVRLVTLSTPERSWSLAEKVRLTLSTGAPFFVFQRYSEEAQRIVDDMVAATQYDAIIAEDNEAALYVRATWGPTKILTKHSILSSQRAQLACIAASKLERWRDRAYAFLQRSQERREASRFDLVKVPTASDLGQWQRITGRSTEGIAITNGVDVSFFPYQERHGDVDSLIYTANFAGVPNVDAVLRFIDDVYPRVTAQIGALPFYVVGRSPPPELQARKSSSIVVTGTVPDVRPYFTAKPIAVVPLRVASGIINKVLEPMALGVAVVATPLAVEGLDTDPRSVCMVAESAEEFADAIVRLASDAALYSDLTRRAREYVVTRHSWPHLMQRYRHAIETAVAHAGSVVPAPLRTQDQAEMRDPLPRDMRT